MADTEFIRKRTAWEQVMYWKLAITKVSGKAFIAVVLAMAQALNGVEWSAFTSTQKFCCIGLALGSGWAIIDAFLDSTMARLSADAGVESTTTTRTDTVVQATTVAVQPATLDKPTSPP